MKSFQRNDKFGGNRGSRDDRDSRRSMTMYQAVCSDCGQRCEVPFKPTGDRPVYCSTCFGNQAGSTPSRSNGKSFGRPSFNDRPKFEAVCDKCGRKCEVPFRPTGDKPIYCSDCFDKGGSTSRTRQTDSSGDQLAAINAKLDRILKVLAGPTGAPTPLAKKVFVEAEEIKIAKEPAKEKKDKKAAKKEKGAKSPTKKKK
ncbi:MAG: CxxC-x17-CxxC domain-containing protein [Patescibacteria group bacterium]